MSDLVGKPEDRFSRVGAPFIMNLLIKENEVENLVHNAGFSPVPGSLISCSCKSRLSSYHNVTVTVMH